MYWFWSSFIFGKYVFNNKEMKLITYIANLHRTGTNESAKRFYGGIGFISCIVMTWLKIDCSMLISVSAGLLGLETITNFFKK